MTTNNSKQSLIAIAAIIIVALLAVNAYLIVKNLNKSKEIELQTQKIDEVQLLKDSLEQEFNIAITELDQMKGTNAELNEIIEAQKGHRYICLTSLSGGRERGKGPWSPHPIPQGLFS